MNIKMRTILLIVLLLVFIKPFSNAKAPIYQDYLVTKSNDTIYGKISWKNNIMVFVENENGKNKYRADKVNFFKKGSFKYVSINTKFPEYLREIINGEISYYVESYIKHRTTIDYTPHVYLKFKEEIYPISLPNVKYNLYSLPITNINGDNLNFTSYYGEIEYQFSSFKSTMEKIIGEDNPIFEMIENGNYTFDDILEIIYLYNNFHENFEEFNNQQLDKKFSRAYIILLNNDTIRGTIKNQNQLRINDQIHFKEQNGEEHKFDPKDVLGFEINDREYTSYIIDRMISDKKIFLEQLKDGEISLFAEYFSPKAPNNFHYQNNLPKPTYFDYNLNVQAKYYLRKNNDEFIPVDSDYEFLSLFKDKTDIYDRIIKNEYKRFEIESMVTLYNNAP